MSGWDKKNFRLCKTSPLSEGIYKYNVNSAPLTKPWLDPPLSGNVMPKKCLWVEGLVHALMAMNVTPEP